MQAERVVSVVETLVRLGGVATRARLIELTSRAEVDRARESGDVVVLARGRYALPVADAARAAAHRLTGIVSHRSAALLWDWAVKTPPDVPEVTIPKNRKVPEEQSRGVLLHRADLGADDVSDGVTSRDRTLVDCLRTLPFDEGLAVADSALRDGFAAARLRALARDAAGPGSRMIRRVALGATGDAANPFESALRAIALDVAGLSVRPQVSIHDPQFLGRPDLVDERLRIALEADSFEWHGGRQALCNDARRYNRFVVRGWLVLRFSWEDVMFHPDEVRLVIEAAVAERTEQRCPRCRAA
jgi:very-short-patch-repair endonuclease